MKRLLTALLLMLMLLPAVAFGDDRAYTFAVTVNGGERCRAAAGDTVTVSLTLHRTAGGSTMYAMQDAVVFDPAFFAFQPDSLLLRGEVEASPLLTLRDGRQALYLGYVAFGDGTEWAEDTVIGSFQLEVLASGGASAICSSDYSVSSRDGMSFYPVSARDAVVVVSEQCRVFFETNGGSAIAPLTMQYGQPLTDVPTPVRAGYTFAGWYTDFDLTMPWEPGAPVTFDITLYAAWQPAAAPARHTGCIIAAAAILLGAAGLACRRLRRKHG